MIKYFCDFCGAPSDRIQVCKKCFDVEMSLIFDVIPIDQGEYDEQENEPQRQKENSLNPPRPSPDRDLG